MRQGAQAAVPAATALVLEESSPNVVALPTPDLGWRCHPRELLERVYAAGSLPVGADDLAIKCALAALAAFGFLAIEEIQADGTARQFGHGEAREGSAVRRPWRVSKPAFARGAIGVPDAAGAFARCSGPRARHLIEKGRTACSGEL